MALRNLLQKHEQLHLYFDDAHGMSWFGHLGRGTVLDQGPLPERMMVAVSLNKAFGAAGGALVFPNDRWKQRVRNVGGPMIFSGPVQPPMLGAAMASARLHLSNEILPLQIKLAQRMRECDQMLADAGLPVVSSCDSPIKFIGLGLPRLAFKMAAKLKERGLFVNLALFPAVSMRQAGIRFTVTCHQEKEDFVRLTEVLTEELPIVLQEEGSSLDEIQSAFRRILPATLRLQRNLSTMKPPGLRLSEFESIEEIGEEWDALLGSKGVFNRNAMRLFEATFKKGNAHDRWGFHYYTVRDDEGHPILATFFTDSLWKEDMLSPVGLSMTAEDRRKKDPYFLSSKVLAMGTVLTEGEHLFLDRQRDWKGAMRMLLKHLEREREKLDASQIVLRDFPADDADMEHFMREQGFLKFSLPPSMVLPILWEDEAGYLSWLSHSGRRHLKKNVLPFSGSYRISVYDHGTPPPSDDEFEELYRLYRNVHERAYQVCTFPLPPSLFRRALEFPGFELVVLRIAGDERPAGMVLCAVAGDDYHELLVGLDYRYVESHALYRQTILQAIRRATLHKKKRLILGLAATEAKSRFGAIPQHHVIYAQSADHYNSDVLNNILYQDGKSRT